MIAVTTDLERVNQSRKKLRALRDMGYSFITTHDDGNTWVPSSKPGLPISAVIDLQFMGNIRLTQEESTKS